MLEETVYQLIREPGKGLFEQRRRRPIDLIEPGLSYYGPFGGEALSLAEVDQMVRPQCLCSTFGVRFSRLLSGYTGFTCLWNLKPTMNKWAQYPVQMNA